VVAAEPASLKLVVAPATIHKLRCGIRGRRRDNVCDALWPARVVLRWMDRWAPARWRVRRKLRVGKARPTDACARLDQPAERTRH
jgi:hypothetical protein